MREKVRMVVVLVVLSALSAILLALIDHVSSDMIEENRERGMKLAVLSALSVPLEDRTPEEVFGSSIKKIKIEAGLLYLSEVEGSEGVAFKVSGPGFWGPISMLLAVDMKDLSIRGVEILEQEETPGLGARIEEPEFRESFQGKRFDRPIRVRSQMEGVEPNDVAAITGATISSKAVESIINESARPYIEAIKKIRSHYYEAGGIGRREKNALLSALQIPVAEAGPENIFNEYIETLDIPEGTLYLAVKSKGDAREIKASAFFIEGDGFMGPVSMVIGVDVMDFSIKGIEILEHSESPGLGARIEEAEFRNMFIGKTLSRPLKLRRKGEELGPNDVAAITGATISSKAVERIINESSRPYIEAIRRLKLD